MASDPGAGQVPSAEQLLAWTDRGAPWPPSVATPAFADVPAAYATALAMRALRQARGERPRGFKIGFTNRNIWPIYQVFAPIWGTVWDSTLHFTDAQGAGTLDLHATCEPRLEPELVFAFRHTPPAGANLAQLFDALDWLAPGVEIVQSHRANWRFAAAAETVADGGMHARLLVGPRIAVGDFAASAADWQQKLAAAELTLIGPDGQPQLVQLPAPSEMEQKIDIARIEGQVKASSVKKVADFVQSHPDDAAGILRSWVAEG